MTDRTYVFRLAGDYTQLERSANGAAAATDKLAGSTEGVARGLAAAGQGGDRFAQRTLNGITASGKLTSQQLTQVGFQLNDFAVQVASGQSPFIALVQQGSQLSGTFGGIGNATRALLSLLTPTRVAVGLLGGGFVALATAAVQGYTEQGRFEKSLLLTGNRAGLTAGKFDQLARSIADSTSATIGSSRQALQAVASTGQFGPNEIEAVTRAVVLYAEVSGESAETVAKDFARMGDSASRFALERNKSLNFLTAAQLKYIRQLEAEGRAEEARIEVSKLLADQLGRKTPQQLGYLQTSLVAVSKVASEFWAALMNFGKPASLDKQLDQAIEVALAAQKNLEELQGSRVKFKGDLSNRQALFDAAKARVDALRAQRDGERQQAREDAEAAKENAKKIAESDKTFVDARLAEQRAGIARQQAAGELARQTELQAIERQYEQLEISAQQYVQRRAAIEKAGIDARLGVLNAEIALERQRQPELPVEVVAQTTRLIELETRRYAILADRVKLEEQQRRGFGVQPRSVAEDPQAAFRQAELAQNEAIADSYRERNVAARQAALELRTTNRALNIDLIRDDRARGLATIKLEEEELRKRLDLAALNAEQRKAVEDDIAAYVALRQAQLTEQLKPQYQRMLEDWADTNRLMRETSDQFQTDFLRTSEDTWVEFVKTGELSFKRLGELLLDTLARYQFQSQVSRYAGTLGSAIAGFFGGAGATNGLGGQNYSGQIVNNPSAYVGGAATGTNFVERDMVTILHKGEAIVPAKFNPAAMGKGFMNQGATPQVTVNVIGGQQPDKVETRQDANGGLSINLIYRQFAERLSAETSQGYGLAPAIQARFGGSGAANLGI